MEQIETLICKVRQSTRYSPGYIWEVATEDRSPKHADAPFKPLHGPRTDKWAGDIEPLASVANEARIGHELDCYVYTRGNGERGEPITNVGITICSLTVAYVQIASEQPYYITVNADGSFAAVEESSLQVSERSRLSRMRNDAMATRLAQFAFDRRKD